MIQFRERKHSNFKDFLTESLKNPIIKKEYDKLQPQFTLIQAVIDARRKKGVTQKELAEKMGTKQSVISRLESGRGNPSFSFLQKLAHALNADLEIRFNI